MSSAFEILTKGIRFKKSMIQDETFEPVNKFNDEQVKHEISYFKELNSNSKD